NELSGGSKAHWLSRAFSEAFLVRATAGAVEDAPAADIVDRLNGVLDQAKRSILQLAAAPELASSEPRPHPFAFVHDRPLRAVLEAACAAGRGAFGEGRFSSCLMAACGVLEAIVPDALAFAGHAPNDWSFDERIAAAERAGLIRGGCARLPQTARKYREL